MHTPPHRLTEETTEDTRRQERRERLTGQAFSLSPVHRRAVCLEEMTRAAEEEMICLAPCKILPGTENTSLSSFFSSNSHTHTLRFFPSFLPFIFSALHPSLVCHGGSAANPSRVRAVRPVRVCACAWTTWICEGEFVFQSITTKQNKKRHGSASCAYGSAHRAVSPYTHLSLLFHL